MCKFEIGINVQKAKFSFVCTILLVIQMLLYGSYKQRIYCFWWVMLFSCKFGFVNWNLAHAKKITFRKSLSRPSFEGRNKLDQFLIQSIYLHIIIYQSQLSSIAASKNGPQSSFASLTAIPKVRSTSFCVAGK